MEENGKRKRRTKDRKRTSTPPTRLEHQINRASAVHIRIIKSIDPEFFREHLSGAYEEGGFSACQLDAEGFLGGVTSDEGPLFASACIKFDIDISVEE